jgi:glycosyltransferase involved in cell wall biosynthesis
VKEQLIINGFPKETVIVVPLHIEKSKISKEKVKENNIKTILYVGRLDAFKGILQFIECLRLLKSQEWSAEIVGDGEMKKEASEFSKTLGLNGRVRFLGNLSTEELNSHYANCSIVVMPSMTPESFRLVGIEAMAFGKPVVAFDSGGVREWLINGKTGFLVNRGDIKGLSERISQLLEDNLLAKSMGIEGQKRVNQCYRKEIHIKRLLSVYEEMIKLKKSDK